MQRSADFGELIKASASCPLFRGLSGDNLAFALSFFEAEIFSFGKNEYIKKPGTDSVLGFFGFVAEGSLGVYMDDYEGNRLVMASVGPGQSFGESLCYLGSKTDIYIEALEDTRILAMTCRNLFTTRDADAEKGSLRAELNRRFTAMLAARTLAMNSRIQVLSKKSLREKIITFLSEQPGASHNLPFTVPMNREDMASYLGSDRAALSRELSLLRKEGKIDFHKNVFRIMPRP